MAKEDTIVVIGEAFADRLDSGFMQLLTKARSIAADKKIIGIIPIVSGTQPEYVTEATYYGADELILLAVAENDLMNDLVIADALTTILRDIAPIAVLSSATPFGRSVAPRIQYDFQTALTADCLDLYFDDELLVQVKPSYGDNILCEIVSPKARPQMATVRPNTFKAKKVTEETQLIRTVNIDQRATLAEAVQLVATKHQSTTTSVADADIILALGRGVQDKQVIATAQKIAERLGGKVGVTRPMTDRDEFTVNDQIGQSGTMVAPKVLLTLGISGAMQFTAGIKNAQTIISINTDDDAPIYADSNIKIVADATAIINELSSSLN